MELNRLTRVGEVVKHNFRTAQIFNRNRIDFCCEGAISINEACEKSDIDVDVLIEELQRVIHRIDPESLYINSLEMDDLYKYIIKKHHSYVFDTIPFLEQKLDELCKVYGAKHPELYQIKYLFLFGAQNIREHLIKEEQILFSYIQQLVDLKNGYSNVIPILGLAKRMVAEMNSEHTAEGDCFAHIASLTCNYTCPSDGCYTYKLVYRTLGEFEKDLQRHLHLENNILFMKAIDLEEKLMTKMKVC